MLLDTVAFAMGAAPGGAEGAGGPAGLLAGPLPMLVLMFAIFYFLLIRPQQKKAKTHKNMLDNLKNGDKVWTNGGIRGSIVEIKDDVVTLEIAKDVKIDVRKGFITDLDGPVAAPEKKK
ncbi:preprotein translocase subunit YajC [Salidesulfovibrio onnuriiensis]|uniref:preprotein translocase subunit YajC n=1 Tax=Salidesulfovibrio onnuriiensis TaxID=2583823 RepID=UPI0011C8DD3C|nr:preprotein translocase subunit YajC [Salidesulfovibrio onnuriiensis]